MTFRFWQAPDIGRAAAAERAKQGAKALNVLQMGGKEMKRSLVFLLMAIALTVWAGADVIFVPEDDFLEEHMDEAQYEGRSYYANSPEGSASLYRAPQEASGGGEEIGRIQNQQLLYIGFTLEYGGQLWGVTEYTTGDGGTLLRWEEGDEGGTGWVRMEELTVRYDGVSFAQEEEANFTDYAGGYDELLQETDLQLYEYPGSGLCVGDTEGTADYPVEFSHVWTDESGKTWGYIAYHMGMEGWVCLEDPENDALPQTRTVEYDFYPGSEETPGAEEAGKPDRREFRLALGLAAGVSVVTLVALSYLARRKPR